MVVVVAHQRESTNYTLYYGLKSQLYANVNNMIMVDLKHLLMYLACTLTHMYAYSTTLK